jgi:hypothetical protein
MNVSLPFPKWVQTVCPSPRRLVQRLIVEQGLRSGLDIGCGSSSLLSPLRNKHFQSTALDADHETIEVCRRLNLHDYFICGEFLETDFDGQYDVVVLSHVIEHFSRELGAAVLGKVESIASRLVYVETPNGFLEQAASEGNAFQRHLSGWFPHDFEG